MKKAEIDEILTPGELAEIEAREQKVESHFWRKVKLYAGKIPFSHDLMAAYYCAMDPKTPTHVRGILLAALVYFIMPADSIPDILVGLGFTDDLTVLTAAIAAVSGYITEDHKASAQDALDVESAE